MAPFPTCAWDHDIDLTSRCLGWVGLPTSTAMHRVPGPRFADLFVTSVNQPMMGSRVISSKGRRFPAWGHGLNNNESLHREFP